MKRVNVCFIVWMVLSPPLVQAQDVPPSAGEKTSSAEKNLWLRINEIEQEKDRIFKQYQQDKKDLDARYQEASNAIQESGAGDTMQQQVRLDKEYNKSKEKLLKAYRQDNWRLEKNENAVKGRKTVVTSDIQLRNRLKNSPNIDSPDKTKNLQEPPGKKNYIKNKQSPNAGK